MKKGVFFCTAIVACSSVKSARNCAWCTPVITLIAPTRVGVVPVSSSKSTSWIEAL